MPDSSQGLSKRDRALAELVRVRGWADDAAIERAISEASGSRGARNLGSVLVAAGVLSVSQVRILEDAVEGRSSRSRTSSTPSRPRGSNSNADRTVARSGAAPVQPASAIRKMPEQVGQYRILRELGRGGMGVVYRALDPELRREVALKVMIAGGQASDGDVERFKREAAVVAKMGRHPHLVQIHDIGRDADRLFFTMDFIEGRSAKQRVEEEGAFPPREAARIAAEVASALAFAHGANIVHRDVKPHNILIDREGRSFLGDFGLARDLTSTAGLTESGSAFGTPAYMSPEQAAGHASQATAGSDVYSLGATLYEMVAGRPPFIGESGMDIVRQVLDVDPTPPRQVREGIHRDLEVVCLKAMHKEPARRYESAAALEADLRRFLNGEPILARPASTLEKIVRKARRHRAVLAVGIVGLLAATGIAVWAGHSLAARKLEEDAKKEDLARRTKEQTPQILEGKGLVERSDEAHRSGGWVDRERFAKRAVDILQGAAKELPESADVHYELGRALRRAGREDEALAALDMAISKNARHGPSWFEKGLILLGRAWRGRAERLRDRALATTGGGGFARAGLTGLPAWAIAEPGSDQAAAAEAFRRVAETATGERADFGRAIVAFSEGKTDAALADIARAIEANGFFVDAIEAKAQMLELSRGDVAAGLAERARLLRLQPQNPAFALEHALALACLDRRAEAVEALDAPLAKVTTDARLLVRAAQVLLACGDSVRANAALERATDLPADAAVAAGRARARVGVALSRGDFAEAERRIAADEAAIGAESAVILRAEAAFLAGRDKTALRLFRSLPQDSALFRSEAATAALAEWRAGNLDRAFALAGVAGEAGAGQTARLVAGLVKRDRGDLEGALAEFAAIRAQDPRFQINARCLAVSLFLKGDLVAGVTALEEAADAAAEGESAKSAVHRLYEPLRQAAAAGAKPDVFLPAATATLWLARAAGGPATLDDVAGFWRATQLLAEAEGRFPAAQAAAHAALRVFPTGETWYRDARVRAKAGKKASVLRSLRRAVAAGFDEAKRLDEEKAFDSVRVLPAFAELRAKCR